MSRTESGRAISSTHKQSKRTGPLHPQWYKTKQLASHTPSPDRQSFFFKPFLSLHYHCILAACSYVREACSEIFKLFCHIHVYKSVLSPPPPQCCHSNFFSREIFSQSSDQSCDIFCVIERDISGVRKEGKRSLGREGKCETG